MNEFVARNGLIALDSSSISGPLTLNGRLSSSNSADTTFSQGSRLVEILTTANGQYGVRSNEAIKAQSFYLANSVGSINAFNGDNLIYFNSSNNLGIGTTNPTAKLDVRGNIFLSGSVTGSDMLIRGSGNTSATTALTVQNSDGSALLTVRNDNRVVASAGVRVGSVSTFAGIFPNGGTTSFEGLLIQSSNTQTFTGVDITIDNAQGNGTATSGVRTLLGIARGFSPTSGTGVWNSLSIFPSINQTGGANGITRGLYVNPTLTAAADWRSIEWSNNTGWGLYGAGTAPNYLGGSLAIGTTATGNYNLRVTKNLTGSAIFINVVSSGAVQSDVTSQAHYFRTAASSANVTFTLSNLYHYSAVQDIFGASSTISSQHGFYVDSTLIGAINNFAFRSDMAAGTGRWNLYMAGTANNYLAGNLGVGVVNPTNIVEIRKDQDASTTLSISNASNTTGSRSTISIGVPGAAINISSIQSNYTQLANFASRGIIITDSTVTNGIVLTTSVGPIGFRPGNITGTDTMVVTGSNVGIGITSPTYRLDVNGSFRATGSITATSGSDYFDISHDITQPAQTGSQVYEVNITPTFRYAAPNQTQTALRVAATFSGSTALSSSQSNIIADFGSTSAGSQLVINDTTSGSIYMVNDVSGLPIIEANSNWDVFIYDYPNVVLKKTGSQIDITGKLKVSGSFILPLSQSTSPETGSAYWSGSFLFVYDGTQYRSASFS